MKTCMIWIPILAILSSTSSASRIDDTILNLVRTYKAGETDRFKTTLKIDGDAGTAEIEIVTSEVVKDVHTDGGYTIASTIDSGKLSLNGAELPFPATGQTLNTTYDKSGRVLKQDSPGEGRRQQALGQLIGLSRLNLAALNGLKVGEARSLDVDIAGTPKVHIVGTITIAGIDKPGGDVAVETAKARIIAEVTGLFGSDRSAHLESTAQIDPRTGRLNRQDGTVTNLQLASLGTGKVTFKRVRMAGKAVISNP